MCTETISLIISGIIAIVSLTIPLIQTSINRKTEERKMLIQLFYEDKLKAFEELMNSFGKYRINDITYVGDFLSSLCKAMLYCDDSVKLTIQYIIDNLKQQSTGRMAYDKFLELIPYFATEIEQSRNKFIVPKSKQSKVQSRKKHK